MKTKKSTELAFYQTKWFKLICLLAFSGWFFYKTQKSFQINPAELIEIKATTYGQSKNGGKRDPIKIYFSAKGYTNRFGIYVGGTFGRWTEVKNALEQNSNVTFKIRESDKNELNVKSEVVPIFYLYTDRSGLVFDENTFNEGEKSVDNRFHIAFIVIFILVLWRILKNEGS